MFTQKGGFLSLQSFPWTGWRLHWRHTCLARHTSPVSTPRTTHGSTETETTARERKCPIQVKPRNVSANTKETIVIREKQQIQNLHNLMFITSRLQYKVTQCSKNKENVNMIKERKINEVRLKMNQMWNLQGF